MLVRAKACYICARSLVPPAQLHMVRGSHTSRTPFDFGLGIATTATDRGHDVADLVLRIEQDREWISDMSAEFVNQSS